MWYVILGRDAEGSLARRRELRAAHLERIDALHREGRILLAGPLPAIDSLEPGEAGFAGSLLVAEFSSLEDARAWAQDDPYVRGGAWRTTEVHPFVRVR